MGAHGRSGRVAERVHDADGVGFVGQLGDLGAGGPAEGGHLIGGRQISPSDLAAAPTPSETRIGSRSENCSERSARADGSGGKQTRWNRVTRLPFLRARSSIGLSSQVMTSREGC